MVVVCQRNDRGGCNSQNEQAHDSLKSKVISPVSHLVNTLITCFDKTKVNITRMVFRLKTEIHIQITLLIYILFSD